MENVDEKIEVLKNSPIDGDLYYFVRPYGSRRCRIATVYGSVFKIWVSCCGTNERTEMKMQGQGQFQLSKEQYIRTMNELSELLQRLESNPDISNDDWWLNGKWRNNPHLDGNFLIGVSAAPGHKIELLFRIYLDEYHNSVSETSIDLSIPDAKELIGRMKVEIQKCEEREAHLAEITRKQRESNG